MSGRHPLGVQPWGNFYVNPQTPTRDAGLGSLTILSDVLLLKVLDTVDPRSLARLAVTSRILRCFAHCEEFWKKFVLEEYEGDFAFRGTWRDTYIVTRFGEPQWPPMTHLRPVEGFYSDLLFQPWFCAHVSIPDEWLATDNICRCRKLSMATFRRRFEEPNIPVILTDITDTWKARTTWNRAHFSEIFKDHEIVVGDYPMKFENYLQYCDAQQDEMPLYLFDKTIFDKCPCLEGDFAIPEVFSEDHFSCLEQRPDYRWLIMGPERSGSSFHKDPNSTSAWNAVIRGSKKWILYPPHTLPPGVHESTDHSEVATSISLVEWFLNFYPETQTRKMKPIECVVHEGEVLFIPQGWWHMALNLEESIAITQNFASSVTLPNVLSFLKTRKEALVSGLPLEQRAQLYDVFTAALHKTCPEVLKVAQERERGQKQSRLFQLLSDGPSLFTGEENSKRERTDPPSSSFKFGFF